MTDIEALVADSLHALHCRCGEHNDVDEENTAAILATPAGQTLARWAAVGEAVERLPAYYDLSHYPTEGIYLWEVKWDYDYGEPRRRVAASTITAAIDAALEGEG